MPHYSWKCTACNGTVDTFFTFAEYDDKKDRLHCSHCDSKLVQVIEAPHCYCVPEANTVGQLADRNAKSMGRYEYEEAVANVHARRKKAKNELWERHGMGEPVELEEPKETWYGRPNREMVKKIANATPQQKIDYVVRGKEIT